MIIEVLGNPFDEKSLDEYIQFVCNADVDEGVYNERHHILPKSVFGENDYVYALSYDDHVKAHFLLAKAYPIREFTRPLNFMLPKKNKESAEYRKIISESAKNNWKKFKKTEGYQQWRKKRSQHMSKIMRDGLASELSKRRYEKDPNAKKNIGKHFEALWQDQEYRNRTINSMKEERQTPEAKKRMAEAARKNWDSRSEEAKEEFKKTMKKVNQDEKKRKDASEKLKKKWQEPEYKEKMSKRKTGNNSNAMKEKWKDPEFRSMMLEKRRKK